MLNLLRPLLNSKTATVNFTLAKTESGDFALTVNPICCIEDHEDKELQALKAALSLPILIKGKFDELEGALADFIGKMLPHRYGWEEQLKSVEAAILAAKTSKTVKGADVKITKNSSTTPPKPKDQNEEETDDTQDSNENQEDLFEL